MSLSTGNPDLSNAPDVNDDLDELFRPMQASITIDTHNNTNPTSRNTTGSSAKRPRTSGRDNEDNDDLGINSAIQITKKRKPIAKLDADR